MDKDSKIKTLLDMQEHPEQFSEEALEQMLGDTEAHELMEATAQLKRAMKNNEFTMSEEEVEKEWQDFASTRFTSQKPRRNWLKVAATFISILFVTGIAIAAIRSLTTAPSPKGEESEHIQNTDRKTGKTTPLTPEKGIESEAPVVFDNVTLDSIAKDIAVYHHIDVDLQNEQAKQLRFYFVWNQEDGLQEVLEKLNMFEHVDMTVENGKLIVR